MPGTGLRFAKMPGIYRDLDWDMKAHQIATANVKFTETQKARYFYWLHEIFAKRSGGAGFIHYHLSTIAHYQPGDYALAALCAVMDKKS